MKVGVAVKVDARTVARLDDLVKQFAPFCEGESSIVRVLVEYALASIDSGTLPFDLVTLQRVLSNSRIPSTPAAVQEIPRKKVAR